MANRWGNSGNSVRLYFLGSKITAEGDCSHEIKRRLLLGRRSEAESEEELKSLLMKEESENAGLKLNIQKLRS